MSTGLTTGFWDEPAFSIAIQPFADRGLTENDVPTFRKLYKLARKKQRLEAQVAKIDAAIKKALFNS